MRRAGVIGWPVEHSRSPLVHGTWLKRHRIAGVYDRIPVPPDELETFFHDVASSGLAGFNVTIPHKEDAARLVSRATPRAVRLGSVNTVWLEGGEPVGDSTDGEGFMASLDATTPGWDADPIEVLVIGAGGAARAIVAALAERANVTRIAILNRTPTRAGRLASDLAGLGAELEAGPLDDLHRRVAAASLLVNASSLGMDDGASVSLEGARPDAVAAEIVYVPPVTPFLEEAAARGLRTVGGLGMLLHQAVPGFERWFGVRPCVDGELERIVRADLSSGGP